MNLKNYFESGNNYKSNSQKARAFTEPFVEENFYFLNYDKSTPLYTTKSQTQSTH